MPAQLLITLKAPGSLTGMCNLTQMICHDRINGINAIIDKLHRCATGPPQSPGAGQLIALAGIRPLAARFCALRLTLSVFAGTAPVKTADPANMVFLVAAPPERGQQLASICYPNPG